MGTKRNKKMYKNNNSCVVFNILFGYNVNINMQHEVSYNKNSHILIIIRIHTIDNNNSYGKLNPS